MPKGAATSNTFSDKAVLKSLPKPKPQGPIHPFAEEEMWGGRPKK